VKDGQGVTLLNLRVISESQFVEDDQGRSVEILPHWSILRGEQMLCSGPFDTLEMGTMLLRLAQAASALLSTDQLRGWMRNHDLAGNIVPQKPRIYVPS
jgi:hypothetical protein